MEVTDKSLPGHLAHGDILDPVLGDPVSLVTAELEPNDSIIGAQALWDNPPGDVCGRPGAVPSADAEVTGSGDGSFDVYQSWRYGDATVSRVPGVVQDTVVTVQFAGDSGFDEQGLDTG